jgi:hypothetical protein
MLRLLLFMHHIAFATHALHVLISFHTYACTLDRILVKSESTIQVEQSQASVVAHKRLMRGY